MTNQKTFLSEYSHIRYNPLLDTWVLVAPHRTKRPWQGKKETTSIKQALQHDETCYLCPQNKRSEGHINPNYKKCYTFNNDFSSLLPKVPLKKINNKGLLKAETQSGICKVIIFSPRHDLTLPELSLMQVLDIVETWCDEYKKIKKESYIKYIQIFENKGEIMGCSNPHPHGQIWAGSSVPMEIANESEQFKSYYKEHGKSLLIDYIQIEQSENERIVYENEHFIALVPFWAIWPYEMLLICKRHVTNILEFSDIERLSLADAVKKVTTIYDNLFECSFPYSAGMHQAPVNNGSYPEWHWHMHFYPPLLRSATVKKFMVGYELLANPQRDITPEFAAQSLRALSTIHYSLKNTHHLEKL